MEEVQFSRKELGELYTHFMVSGHVTVTCGTFDHHMTSTFNTVPQEGHRQATFWGGGLQYSVISNSSKTEPTIDKKRFVALFCQLSPWKHIWQVEKQAELAFEVSLNYLQYIHTCMQTVCNTSMHCYTTARSSE